MQGHSKMTSMQSPSDPHNDRRRGAGFNHKTPVCDPGDNEFDALRIPSRNKFWAGSSVTEDLLMTEHLNFDHLPSSRQFASGKNTSAISHGNDPYSPHLFPPTTWSSGDHSPPDSSCRYVDSPFAIGMPWEQVERPFLLPTEKSRKSSNSSTSSPSSSSPIVSGFQALSLSSHFQEKEDEPDLEPSEYETSPPIEYVNLMKACQEWMRYKQRNPSLNMYSLPKPFQSQEDKGCVLCKKNCKPKSFYSTHVLKDNHGVVICPVLREFTCPRCGATGDRAHTLRFCPVARKENHI